MYEEHVSPDGKLHFFLQEADGDIILGFHGYGWHTHGDLLESMYAGGPSKAAAQFAADLISGKLTVAVYSVSGKTRDIRVSTDPAADLRYCEPDEIIAFRLWDGTEVVV